MKFAIISAMYENGGNTLQRLLDGHPDLLVYPFESQLGNKYVLDEFSSMFPFRYRWPDFLQGYCNYYDCFYDEELKTYLRRKESSKFKNCGLIMDETKRIDLFSQLLHEGKEKGHIIKSFFKSTFDSWENMLRSGKEQYYVGYSPIIIIDTEKIFSDLPESKILHIVRDPLACYATTKKRPFPMSLESYCWAWNIVQQKALYFDRQYGNIQIIQYKDIINDRKEAMTKICSFLKISYANNLLYPSFNSTEMKSIYPWGTIIKADHSEQEESINLLSDDEIKKVKDITRHTYDLIKHVS